MHRDRRWRRTVRRRNRRWRRMRPVAKRRRRVISPRARDRSAAVRALDLRPAAARRSLEPRPSARVLRRDPLLERPVVPRARDPPRGEQRGEREDGERSLDRCSKPRARVGERSAEIRVDGGRRHLELRRRGVQSLREFHPERRTHYQTRQPFEHRVYRRDSLRRDGVDASDDPSPRVLVGSDVRFGRRFVRRRKIRRRVIGFDSVRRVRRRLGIDSVDRFDHRLGLDSVDRFDHRLGLETVADHRLLDSVDRFDHRLGTTASIVSTIGSGSKPSFRPSVRDRNRQSFRPSARDRNRQSFRPSTRARQRPPLQPAARDRQRRHLLQAPQRPGLFHSLTRRRRLAWDLPRSVPPRPSQPATRLRKALELRRAPFSSRGAPQQARVDARPPRLSRSSARRVFHFPRRVFSFSHTARFSGRASAVFPGDDAPIPPAASRLSRSLETRRSSTRTTTRLFALHSGP